MDKTRAKEERIEILAFSNYLCHLFQALTKL